MSPKTSLAQRLLAMSRPTSQHRHYTMTRPNLGPNHSAMDPDPGDNSTGTLAHQFIQRRAAAFPPELRPMMQEHVLKRLGFSPLDRDLGKNFPLWSPSPSPSKDDVQKLLPAAQMEIAKARLRERPETWMEYEEFVRVCGSGFSDPGRGVKVSKMLVESGHVVILGDHVLLKPELVREAIVGLMPVNGTIGPKDSVIKELEAMEKERMAIDAIVVGRVKRELWCGLGFLVAQTVAFMRLTFWELTWDVMEPICFYLTSIYFMAGYAFFLLTSREPSFEGFFHSRLATKRKQLMDARGFDLRRYKELLRVSGLSSSAVSRGVPFVIRSPEDAKLDSFCK